MPDDADAVARVLGGDTEAFSLLVRKYGGRLRGMCLARLGDRDDADDAVQDVFARAFKSLASYDPERSFASWLFAIAANRVKSRYAARAARSALDDKAGAEALVESSERTYDPAGDALDALASEALRSAVAALPRGYRAPVELYYFAGLSVADAAATLGLGEEAVKSRLFRARKALARVLDPGAQPADGMKGRR